MKLKTTIFSVTLCFLFLLTAFRSAAHDIYFCGEKIPLTPRVADKLMDIIRKQIKYNVVSHLKQKDNYYIKTIELILKKTGLPDDFKYLAIVESGLRNVQSPVGAAGYWQIMPGTAKDLNLVINGEVDERNDIYASTIAACNLLYNYFKEIKKNHKVSSWVLTAAAYNYGSGNMKKVINTQGNDYFKMNLNKETSEYVYKIIAVKELFEYPELYLKDFGYNVFNTKATAKLKNEKDDVDKSDFDAISIKVDDKNENRTTKDTKSFTPVKNSNVKSEGYVFAYITGDYPNFKDSSEIKITLKDPLRIENSLKNRGKIITGIGWKIDDKIFVDFGYGKKLIIIDHQNKKHDGIAEAALKDKHEIALKVTEFYN
ncbi:MAG: lytic transglycosylase domain-containing protein [Chitinophagaceae bacterium]|nr:lytic transglycosylase domain-containing protein [Chitinophagaceae bacterium]